MKRYIDITKYNRKGNKTYIKESNARSKKLKKYANGINAQNNKSDLWLKHLWIESGLYIDVGLSRDRFNFPFCYYIPDLVNFYYKYVIECDGTSHNTKKQKKIDAKKDQFYIDSGYSIFRVESHNYKQFTKAKEQIIEIRRMKRMYKL